MAITTVAGIIREHGAARPEAVAVVYGDRTLTYGDLDDRSNRLANGLAAEGVASQERVAYLDRNAPEFLDAMFATAKIGAVLCPVNWRLAPAEAAFIVNDSEARVLIVGEELLPMLDEMTPELTAIRTVVVVGADPSGRHPSYDGWLAALPATDPGLGTHAHGVGRDDVAMQFYSSGTTGRPKGVMITNANLFAQIDANNTALRFGSDSVNLVAMPTFHVAGGAWALIGLYNGVPNVLMREVDPAAIIDAIARHGVTHAVLVPAVIQFALMVPGVEDADFSSLEVLVYGASPISEEVLTKAIRTFGCDFLQAYGMTETTGGCVLLPPEDHDPDGPNAHRLRAAGKPGPNTELRVVDAATLIDVPVGEVGEILVRSPQNMKGYWHLPEATAATIIEGGWLRTGDAGYLDEDGYVYIHDRVKDMIISGGENIYPAEVEHALMAHPGIADVAVIGVPHERWGETPKAIVVRATGTDVPGVSEGDVIAFARRRLAHYKCPTSVEFVDVLPRNPSGKILKKDLRAPYWEGRERFVG
jgi:long-chain acyl-CoA synthetase